MGITEEILPQLDLASLESMSHKTGSLDETGEVAKVLAKDTFFFVKLSFSVMTVRSYCLHLGGESQIPVCLKSALTTLTEKGAISN